MDWNHVFYEKELSEEFVKENIHHIRKICSLFKGETLKKGRISLPSSDPENFDEHYEDFLQEMYHISADSMVDVRRDNDNIWKEYESYREGCFIIETFFTEKEIEFLQTKYPRRFKSL